MTIALDGQAVEVLASSNEGSIRKPVEQHQARLLQMDDSGLREGTAAEPLNRAVALIGNLNGTLPIKLARASTTSTQGNVHDYGNQVS